MNLRTYQLRRHQGFVNLHQHVTEYIHYDSKLLAPFVYFAYRKVASSNTSLLKAHAGFLDCLQRVFLILMYCELSQKVCFLFGNMCQYSQLYCNWFKLVFGQFGQNNKNCTLDFWPQQPGKCNYTKTYTFQYLNDEIHKYVKKLIQHFHH